MLHVKIIGNFNSMESHSIRIHIVKAVVKRKSIEREKLHFENQINI